jgi:hypothetical protein
MMVKRINTVSDNIWLSSFIESEDGDSEDVPEPHNNLNDRQKKLYEYYESLVEEFGMFDQSSKANGAHYAPGNKNPFISSGMICKNCVFFVGGGGCELVKGVIQENAICKFWIIPEVLIK